MATLSARDSERLLRFVGDAHELAGEQAVTPELLVELGKLIDADWVSYSELDRVRRRELYYACRPGEEEGEDDPDVYWDVVNPEHPICATQGTAERGALKLSDFMSLRELRRSRLYDVWFRPFGVERQLSVALPSPLWHTKVLMFDRGRGRDFSERDRAVLDRLRPHLAQLWEAARTRRLLRAALGGTEEVELVPPLTAREREVLGWVAQGKTNSEIAELLWLAPSTVRKHLENVYAKLGVSTRTAAVARFFGLKDAQAS